MRKIIIITHKTTLAAPHARHVSAELSGEGRHGTAHRQDRETEQVARRLELRHISTVVVVRNSPMHQQLSQFHFLECV